MTRYHYPWRLAEARALHVALYEAITQPQRIELIFKESVRDDGPPLTLGTGPAIIWQEVLDEAAIAGRLSALCDRLLEQSMPGVRAAVEALRRVWADATDSPDRSLVVLGRFRGGDGTVTINRRRLRDHLTLLINGSVRILLVRGRPRTGKTWSHRLFGELAKAHGARFVYLDSESAVDIDTALDTLFSQFNDPTRQVNATDRIPHRVTTDVGWYQKVGNRLREEAEAAGRPLWVAVDEVGPDDSGTDMLDDEVRAFFQKLAHTLDQTNNAWFRLMFIHYPDERVPTKWGSHLWREDRTDDADVSRDDIVEVLQEWADDRGKRLLADEVTRHADDIIAAADAPPDGTWGLSRVERISEALESKLATLAGPP